MKLTHLLEGTEIVTGEGLRSFIQKLVSELLLHQNAVVKEAAEKIFKPTSLETTTEARYYKFMSPEMRELHPYVVSFGDKLPNEDTRRRIANLINSGHDYVNLHARNIIEIKMKIADHPTKDQLAKLRDQVKYNKRIMVDLFVLQKDLSLYDLHSRPKKLHGVERKQVTSNINLEITQQVKGSELQKILYRELRPSEVGR